METVKLEHDEKAIKCRDCHTLRCASYVITCHVHLLQTRDFYRCTEQDNSIAQRARKRRDIPRQLLFSTATKETYCLALQIPCFYLIYSSEGEIF
jgi:hypothetical protein